MPKPKTLAFNTVGATTGRSKSQPPMIYMGIDPGANGAIVVLSEDGVTCDKIPESLRDMWDWVRYYERNTRDVVAVIEKVGGFMGGVSKDGQQRNVASGHTMFTFGRGVGRVEAMLTAAFIPYEEVLPKTWQSAFGIQGRKKGEPKPALKRRCKETAQRLFPDQNVTLGNADALLLALYCKRKHTGTLAR